MKTLPVALVEAYVGEGERKRAVMPRDDNGVERTEEVREALTRMCVDADYYLSYCGARDTALQNCGIKPYDFHDVEFDGNLIAQTGFSSLGSDTLAGLALNPEAYEVSFEMLMEAPHRGEWYLQAKQRWNTEPKQ